MNNAESNQTNEAHAGGKPYYASRRAFLKAVLLASGGLACQLAFPSSALAKKKPRYYSVIYRLNGGKNPKGQVKRIKRNRTVAVSKLKKPTRKGYTFVNWYSNSGLTKKAKRVRGVAKKAKRTVYAKWKINKYSITYNLNGGKATLPLPKRYTVNSEQIKPFTPTKDGSRFVGWYSDGDFKNARPTIDKGSIGDVKLHAKWAATDYWDNHIETRCKRVNTLAQRMENGLPSFVFITDMHLPSNALVSPYLVRKVVRKTDANMVIFGGDAINAAIEKDNALRMLSFIRNSFPGIETHMIRGNHDGNGEGSTYRLYPRITEEEFLEVTAGDNEVREGGNLYYYRDDDVHKVRFIFLDSGAPNSHYVDDKQLDWLSQRILELDEQWTVLVFVHQFFQYFTIIDNDKSYYDKNGTLIKAKLDSIYDSSRARIAGVISGHCHRDHGENSEKGYAMISTTRDFLKVSGSEDAAAKLGTTKEQAFDIVTLDTANEIIYLTRIGRGSNREFSYAPPAPPTPPEPETPENPVEPEPTTDQNSNSEPSPESGLQAAQL